jgi:predicted GNAT family acetyltransferase
MRAVTITRELSDNKGRYVARVDGVAADAELTFSRASPTLIIADHTYTPEAMRGMGVAKALVERLVADARAEGFQIIPLCSYVKAQSLRHPEWSDVMHG